MNASNYILIQPWMVTDLKLKGNQLLIFAIVYQFSCDGTSKYLGGLDYIQKWLNYRESTIHMALHNLKEKGYIIKDGQGYKTTIFDASEAVKVEQVKKEENPIEFRSKKFYHDIADVLHELDFKTNPQELRKFYEYWSEHGINDKKMRFEKEKSFNLIRRLRTWFENAEKFNKTTTEPTGNYNQPLN